MLLFLWHHCRLRRSFVVLSDQAATCLQSHGRLCDRVVGSPSRKVESPIVLAVGFAVMKAWSSTVWTGSSAGLGNKMVLLLVNNVPEAAKLIDVSAIASPGLSAKAVVLASDIDVGLQ